jgi:alpha-2-macroglobulin
MYKPILALATVAVVIFFYGCSRNIVALESTTAKGEIPPLGNLVFRFNKTLVSDSMLNRWDSTEYVSFTPKIQGRFRWEDGDKLVFSPAAPLPPATSFEAELNDELIDKTEYNKIDGDEELKFHTPLLRLEDVNVRWVLTEQGSSTAAPEAELFFNYPVDAEKLKENLDIKVEGNTVAYALRTVATDSRVTVRLNSVKADERDLSAIITVKEGVVPVGGVNPTKEEIEANTVVPSPFNLSINDVSSEHDGQTGTIFVRTSQQVVPSGLSSFVTVQPSAKLRIAETEDGFAVSSDDFDANKSYVLTVSKGLKGRIGGTLKEAYDNNVAFGELEPSVRLVNSKAMYLSGTGNRNVEMRIVNVEKVKVIVSKVYESNLLVAQRYGYYPPDRSADENDYYYNDYNEVDVSFGDVIFEKEIDTRMLPKYGNSRLFSFNIDDKLPEFKGIYHVKVRSTKDYWISDSRFVSVSDIGLIAKEARDKIVVFANSIRTTDPVQGLNIIVYGNNNQVLGKGESNKDGVAEIAMTRKEFAGFRPAILVAKSENDFTYLPFNSTKVSTSRFEVGGKRLSAAGLDAFVYGERDLYRPGETIRYSVIVRKPDWGVPGELPLKLRFLQPNGKEFKSFRKTLNEQGSLEGELAMPASAVTGTYVLEVYTSNDLLLASKNYSLEEFVPDRIKVTAALEKKSLAPGESTTFNINAVNFFGPPAANRNYESEIQVRAKYFGSKKYSAFDFTLKNEGLTLDKVVKEGKTDENGNATEQYTVPQLYSNSGLLQATFYATVFDETGRPVSRSTSADIYTQPYFLGLKDEGNWYYPLNQQGKIALIAVDKADRAVNAKAQVRLIKHEYRTVLSRAGSYFRYDSQKEEKIISDQTINVSGESTMYTFVPRSPGNYEIRVHMPGSASYLSRHFYSYGSWGGENASFEVNTEGNIDIEIDKESYEPGEKVKALFKTPFNGRMLVTMENDKVVSHQYVNVDKRSAMVELPVTAEHLPNIYVTATLIKRHEISDIPLTVAHGFQNLKVFEKKRINQVKIDAGKSVRSATVQKVVVTAAPNSYVTLAAVDNGVLQINNYQTPDPYTFFYSTRALAVNAYDLYPLLFPELRSRLSSTGGDGDLEMSKRLNPMPSKRVRVASYWSGITKTNGGGQATFSIPVPKFSGQLRLMAVAYKNESFGSAEVNMTVADPLVLSTALPRFLSPMDTANVPVTITNTTNRAMQATASIKLTGPLRVAGSNTQSVSVPAGSEFRANFKVVAGADIDTGRVVIEVAAGKEKFTDETSIGVRPASPLLVKTGSGTINGGGTASVRIPVEGLMPASIDYELVVSKNPATELGRQLRYVLRYPYGCTEQTISAAFPQLYYSDLAQQTANATNTRSAVNENILEAIRKIRLRQLYNGAVTLWDGEGEEHWWSTIYAAHFLIEAEKAGFEIEPKLLSNLLNYMNGRLRNKSTVNYYYNRDQQKKIAPKEVAYSLFVLALAGSPNISSMNYYKAKPELLSLDSRYLLSAAYALGGDKNAFRQMLPQSFAGESSVPETGGSWSSPIRDEAIALTALLAVDQSHPQIPIMIKHISDQLKAREWYNTQECSFSFIALGKVARAANQSNVNADIIVNGKSAGTFKGNTLKLTAAQLKGSDVRINTSGNGRLYYYWQAEGISAQGEYAEEDQYLKIRRQFFDRYGRRIDGNSFRQNDLIVVQLTLEKNYNTDVFNIAISDLLPAGFEIENPRTKEIPGMDWITNADNPLSLDVRDDRVNFFVDLTSAKQVYYYAVRAVSPGEYRLPPAAAEAMYNAEYHSYNGGGKIVVTAN